MKFIADKVGLLWGYERVPIIWFFRTLRIGVMVTPEQDAVRTCEVPDDINIVLDIHWAVACHCRLER
jgi:hypothetical protein